MAKSRFYYRTENLGSYTGRIAQQTETTARRLLVRGEDRLQAQIRRRTPKDTGKLRESILTQHKGSWESVRSAGNAASMASVTAVDPAAFVEGGFSRAGRMFNGYHPFRPFASYMVRVQIFAGSVFTDVDYAPYVEHDTGRYGPNPGSEPGGRYAIVPRTAKVLVFYIDGRKIVIKKVRHPGSRGKHMFSRGAAFVSRPGYLHNQSRDILARWRASGAVVRPR